MLRAVRLTRFYSTRRFTPEHEWVMLQDDTATVGISDYAQKALGDVVYVELPSVGKTFEQKQVLGAVESVKAASDVYVPIAGEIVEVNQKLDSAPNLINSSAETDGWLAKIKVSDKSQFDKLMDDAEYKAHCEKTAH